MPTYAKTDRAMKHIGGATLPDNTFPDKISANFHRFLRFLANRPQIDPKNRSQIDPKLLPNRPNIDQKIDPKSITIDPKSIPNQVANRLQTAQIDPKLTTNRLNIDPKSTPNRSQIYQKSTKNLPKTDPKSNAVLSGKVYANPME